MSRNPVVGLFGTCGDSTWRTPIISALEKAGIEFFNPQVAPGTWHPGMVDDENRHLKEDDIVLFPVLAETTGVGSLGEIGFSVLNAVRHIGNRYLIVMIDDDCTDTKADAVAIKNSKNARALVKSKLAQVEHPNVFLVKDLDAMQTMLVELVELFQHQHDVAQEYSALRA